MTNSFSKPIDQFPYQELHKLSAKKEPDYNDLQKLQKQLNANAMSVESQGGSGRHGFIALVVDEATNMDITGHVFTEPTRPDPVPMITQFASASQITLLIEEHKLKVAEWTNYNNTLKALRKQLLEAVPRDLIEELADSDSDFNNVSPLKIITYLKSLYGKITPMMLQANYDKLSEAWNPTDPINALWRQVKECRDFAEKGKEPIPTSTVIRLVTNNLDLTGVFTMDMHDWYNKPEADQQDYDQLRIFFNRANCNRINKMKKDTSGFAGAATPPPAHPSPSANQPPGKPKPAPTPTKPPPKNIPLRQPMDVGPLQYCFTHGFNNSHNGKECKAKCDNHNDSATVKNMKGGNNTIQRRKGEKRIHVPPDYEKINKKVKFEEE
jgi:hypothetical protein